MDNIVLGGPAGIKSRVLKSWNLELQPIVKTISRGGEDGLRECIEKANQDLSDQKIQDQLDLLREFYLQLEISPDSIIVGAKVMEMYHLGLVKSIWTTDIASTGLDLNQIGFNGSTSGSDSDQRESDESDDEERGSEGSSSRSNDNGNGNKYGNGTENQVKKFRKIRDGMQLDFGTTLFIVSPVTDLGARFQREFMGLAAITYSSTANH